jgi:ubiquitin carboxyl-terminal hydrolase 25/28
MVEAEQSDTDSPDSAQTLVNPADEEVSLITQEKDNAAPKDSHEEQAPANTADDHARDGGTKTSKLSVEELAAELDKPNVGSDQMDVDEVMGNAIDHLRAAFKVAHISSDDVRDPIEWAFFSTFIDNRKKIGETEWNRTKRLDRWVTAYPAQSGPRDLYDALENSFDLERLPGDLLSFTTIQTPAPHFHICIQRSDGVRKNANPITIPETLYLDRFMDSGDHDSPLSKARKRRWDIKTRLNELTQTVVGEAPGAAKVDARVAEGPSKSTAQDDFSIEEVDDFLVIGHLDAPGGESSSAATSNVNAELAADKMELDPAIEALLGKYGVGKPESIEASAMPAPQPSADRSLQLTPSELDEFWTKFGKEEADERDRLIVERAELFSGSQQVAYRLHAVVCHAGSSASAGHYWVWIHDFEQDVWRKYNDTTVSVHPAEFVFEQLNTKGEPYYLAYVRAEDVHQLVSIPRRRQQVPPVPPPPQQEQQQKQPRESVEDVVMVDGGDGTAALAHIEPLPAYTPA